MSIFSGLLPKSMSLYIDYKYNKIIDIVMQTEIERNKGR